MWHLKDTQQTGSMQNSNIQPTVCLKSLIFNAVCVCVAGFIGSGVTLWVSPKHVFHPFLLFSPKLEFYKVMFLTVGDHNLMTVHKGWPLKWKLLTSNRKECDRITMNRIESLLTEMIPRERAFSAPIYVFKTSLWMLVLFYSGNKQSTVNHGTTKQCLTSMKHILNNCSICVLPANLQVTFSGCHTFLSQTHIIASQPF